MGEEDVVTTRTAIVAALEQVICHLDYDHHKALLDPEDESGETYADIAEIFFSAL